MTVAPRPSWSELRHYWETHTENDGALDFATDPDALGNVCWPGAPLWLNAHMARVQTETYRWLLAWLPPPEPGDFALDVGCGAGRWCRLLGARGYDVVGIDLQPALIEADRRRYPDMRFERTALQDYEQRAHFAVASSVTVIQHNPFEEQVSMVHRLRELIRDGGHVLIMENIHDPGPYIFSRTVGGWISLFESFGFHLIAHRQYDYSLLLRGVRAVGAKLNRGAGGAPVGPYSERPSGIRRGVHSLCCYLDYPVLRTAATLDRRIDAFLARCAAKIGATHCGLIFEAGP